MRKNVLIAGGTVLLVILIVSGIYAMERKNGTSLNDNDNKIDLSENATKADLSKNTTDGVTISETAESETNPTTPARVEETGSNSTTSTTTKSTTKQTTKTTTTPATQAPAPTQAPVAPTLTLQPSTVIQQTQRQAAEAPAPTNSSTVTGDDFLAAVEQEIFRIVNVERANAGMGSLLYNYTMEKYARVKAKDMGDKDYFAHEDLQGKKMIDYIQQDGVPYTAWGENIAYYSGAIDVSTLAQKFMTNWMNSPGHRANILSGNFESIGVGVYKIGSTYYAVQEFYSD